MIERIELDQIDLKKRLLLILLQLQEWRLLQKSNQSGNAGKARKAVPEWNCERKSLSSPIGRGAEFRDGLTMVFDTLYSD